MKKLGQYFLKDDSAVKKIIDALDIKKGEVIIEIGPGRGALTIPLAKNKIKIIAIEKDNYLADKLKERKITNLKIIAGDALKELPLLTKNLKKYKLVGNIPYYLTGFLLRTISQLKNLPALIVFTVQKEVGERASANPPKMNLLAASIQVWAKPEIIAHLPATSFDPQPKVESVVLRLETKNKIRINDNYYDFIKKLFKQPRKTILNNLRDGFDNLNKERVEKILEASNIKTADRPQNLNINQIIELENRITPLVVIK